ncbi:hypothetical protein PC128_g14504 [Phytophthora cactorum]|nr:hypothetical protein PC128_g14504 [Phytophthora cactorum]
MGVLLGTSNWSVSEITEACEIADRLSLIRPIVEQSQYSIFERNRIEFEHLDLFKKYKYGITAWSPLAFGSLTGKYGSGCPQGFCMYTEEMRNAIWRTDFEERVQKADKLKPIAAELGCSLAQLALAWCVANENVLTAIVGAGHQSQLEENLKALEFVDKITPDVKAKVDDVVNFVPGHPVPDRLREIRKRHL